MREVEKAAEDVHWVVAVGEPPGRAAGEVDAVRQVVCPGRRVPHIVVVPVVHKRTPENKHGCNIGTLLAGEAGEKGTENDEEAEEKSKYGIRDLHCL